MTGWAPTTDAARELARVGSGLGALLNATFGSAAELIIANVALRAGLYEIVKASITGSTIGNILLVFGLSARLGSVKYPIQRFNRTAASLGSNMLVLSAIEHSTAILVAMKNKMDLAINIACGVVETHWMEGIQLLAVYVILGMAFFFLPM